MGRLLHVFTTAGMALLLFSPGLGAQSPPAASPTPDGNRLVIPRARRTLAEHVKAIRAQAPPNPYGDRALELDELVCPERALEWGAEGSYWDVVLSLAKSASLDVEDSWTQRVKLVPVPGKLRAARIEGSYLLGFRWEKSDDGKTPLLNPVIVMPPWWDLGGTRSPQLALEHGPDAAKPAPAPRDCVLPFEVPPSVVRLKVTWEIERYLRASTEELPCKPGARFQVAGAGAVEILSLRPGKWKQGGEPDNTFTVVDWRTTELRAEREELILDDHSKASFVEASFKGRQHNWTYQSTFKADPAKAKTFRVKLIHEAVTEHPALAMDRAVWQAAPVPDLLAGSISWPFRPPNDTVVLVGALREFSCNGPSRRMGWREPRTIRAGIDPSSSPSRRAAICATACSAWTPATGLSGSERRTGSTSAR
jgi:hypothetical protein